MCLWLKRPYLSVLWKFSSGTGLFLRFAVKNSCILAQMLPVLVASECLPSTGNRDQSLGQAVRMGSLVLCPARSISSLSGEGPQSSGATSQFNFHVLFIFHILYSLKVAACLPPSQELKCANRWICIKLEGLKQWFPLKSVPTDNCLEDVWGFYVWSKTKSECGLKWQAPQKMLW